MRPLPSRSSKLGRIRKASGHRCGGPLPLSTAHSLQNQVKVFTLYSRHFQKWPQFTFLWSFLLRPPATTTVNTHTPTYVLPAEQPQWTFYCLNTAFSHQLCLVKLLPIAHSSSPSWDAAFLKSSSKLQGRQPCPVSSFILPSVSVCASQSSLVLSTVGPWEEPGSCDGKCSMYLPNWKLGAWRKDRAKVSLELSAKPWHLESGKTM